MNNDDFWGITNPTDVLIDTANREEMMAGSHITEFHTHTHTHTHIYTHTHTKNQL